MKRAAEPFSGESVGASFQVVHPQVQDFLVRSGWREAVSLQGTQAVIRMKNFLCFPALRG